jgi:hypothetical protein
MVAGASSASATAKPIGDLVPAGAKVLIWNYPLPTANKVLTGTLEVTNPTIIAQVRSLINSLPVTSSAHRICPDDMMLPYTVGFALSTKAKPFTRVVFQLGGCPYARVYQHGVAISPTLGGPNLSWTYARIQHLISPKGQPLA